MQAVEQQATGVVGVAGGSDVSELMVVRAVQEAMRRVLPGTRHTDLRDYINRSKEAKSDARWALDTPALCALWKRTPGQFTATSMSTLPSMWGSRCWL